MRHSHRRLLTGGALVLGALPCAPALHAAPQSKNKPELAFFEGELEAARDEARKRNVPLLVLAILEGEEENDRFRGSVVGNSEIAKGTDGTAIVILTNDGTHSLKKVAVEDEEGKRVQVEVCSVFGTRSCEAHKQNWDRVYLDYTDHQGGEGEWDLPETLVIRPDGTLASRHNTGNPPPVDEFMKALLKVQRESGKGLTRDEWMLVLRELEAGRGRLQSETWAEAWRAFDAVLGVVGTGPYGTEAKAGADKALGAMRARIEAAQKLLAPETVREGFGTLLDCAQEYGGTPVEKELAAAIKEAESDKELKPLIAAYKVERAAEELWEESQELERAGDEKGARRVLRKLLGKRYTETPAAKRAREKYPDLG